MNDFKKIRELEFDLLQCKYVYYGSDLLVGVSDNEYNKLQEEYLALCDKNNMLPWVYYMVGYDSSNLMHDVVNLSIKKYGGVNLEN